jgi:hypothetical protein
MSSYSLEIAQFLIPLGFPESALRSGLLNVEHPTHRGLVVSVGRHASEFRLRYTGRKLDGVKIPTRLVSTFRPRWKQTVSRWYQHAVFALADIKRKQEEAETLKKRQHEELLTRITDLIPADVNVTAEEVQSLVPLMLDDEGNVETAQYYNAVSLNLQGLAAGELVSILARLKAFLKEHNIPHR